LWNFASHRTYFKEKTRVCSWNLGWNKVYLNKREQSLEKEGVVPSQACIHFNLKDFREEINSWVL
jgi:hypothetical protein